MLLVLGQRFGMTYQHALHCLLWRQMAAHLVQGSISSSIWQQRGTYHNKMWLAPKRSSNGNVWWYLHM